MLIRRRPPRLLSFRLFALSSSSSSSCRPRPYSLPLLKSQIPKNIPFAVSAVGKTWDDPYRWISKTDDPDLIDFLHRENSYAEAFMADTKHLQERLVAEMKARMLPKVTTPPESWGDWL